MRDAGRVIQPGTQKTPLIERIPNWVVTFYVEGCSSKSLDGSTQAGLFIIDSKSMLYNPIPLQKINTVPLPLASQDSSYCCRSNETNYEFKYGQPSFGNN